MFFSRVVLVALWSLTAVASKDNDGCTAFPREKASFGNHAMLQQSAKPSKGDVLEVSGNVVPPADPRLPSGLRAEGSLQANSLNIAGKQPRSTVLQVDDAEWEVLDEDHTVMNKATHNIRANVQPQLKEQQLLETESVSNDVCDWQCYINSYPDLQSVVGADLVAAELHWNTFGKGEGRDCTCVPVESLAVVDDTAHAAELSIQFKASANVMSAVTRCKPLSREAQAAIAAEIKDYERSEKFQQKILEAQGKSPASAGHVGIMKYLREKVLKKGFSILELGAGAGGMLRFIEDEYNMGWGGGHYAEAVPHGSLVGVELVPGWVKFAQEHFENIDIFQGDITDYSLPEPYAGERFDLVMLNDVMEHVQRTRFGCFFAHLDKVTKAGSLVYMHTPSPMAQVQEQTMLSSSSTQTNENIVPHHFVVTGMATMGFELLAFEHDMDTVCGGAHDELPKALEGAHCYYNGWPKYTHNVFRRVDDAAVMSVA